MVEQIFFELIRIAIGTQSCLTKTPSASEWKKLYFMAKKQSLVGVCFVGVQILRKADETNGTRLTENLPKTGYVKWMGMAAKIQRKNEKVNKQCVELQEMLAADGLRSCILKGQGVGTLYKVRVERLEVLEEMSLADLRQSGDIDVWMEGGHKYVMDYVNKIAPTKEVRWLHTQLHVFEDTEVEVHFMPTYLKCPQSDKVLQAFFDTEKEDSFKNGIASQRLNEVFILAHAYRHLTNEGVGLRQLMDYFFVLMNRRSADTKLTREEFVSFMRKTGMLRFAHGVMWMMHSVFDLPEEYLLCEPSKKDGQFLLEEVMKAGNFGHYDERVKHDANESTLHRFWRLNTNSFRVFRFAPMEVLWAPIWRIKHWCWRKTNGYK